jgi:hypothetical protein
MIVATGTQAAVVVAVGARGRGVGDGIVYTVSELAARHGVSVERETKDPAKAYEKVPLPPRATYRPEWLPGND